MASRSAQAVDFGPSIAEAYATGGAAIELGLGVHEDTLVPEASVRVPLGMMNRHGLIAGATGTGKTRTLHHRGAALRGRRRGVRRCRQGRARGHGGSLPRPSACCFVP